MPHCLVCGPAGEEQRAISYGAAIDDLPGLDLSYTPPLGSPWDAIQAAARAWAAAAVTVSLNR